MSLIEELKFNFRTGGTLIRLIFINISVFILFGLTGLIAYLFKLPALANLPDLFSVPASFYSLIQKPWTPISYMFIHQDIFHVLGNMLMLYFGGRLFTEFLGNARIFPVYLMGGLFGAVLFIAAFNALPAFEGMRNGAIALGASASVLAVFFAIASYLPNYQVNLFIIGFVKLKWVALILLVFDLISINKGNPGGHIAHIGGALFGYLYAMQLRKGNDLGKPIMRMTLSLQSLFRKKTAPPHARAFKQVVIDIKNPGERVTRSVNNNIDSNSTIKSRQEIIDEILDKISRSGYESLTKEEKETIFRISRED